MRRRVDLSLYGRSIENSRNIRRRLNPAETQFARQRENEEILQSRKTIPHKM